MTSPIPTAEVAAESSNPLPSAPISTSDRRSSSELSSVPPSSPPTSNTDDHNSERVSASPHPDLVPVPAERQASGAGSTPPLAPSSPLVDAAADDRVLIEASHTLSPEGQCSCGCPHARVQATTRREEVVGGSRKRRRIAAPEQSAGNDDNGIIVLAPPSEPPQTPRPRASRRGEDNRRRGNPALPTSSTQGGVDADADAPVVCPYAVVLQKRHPFYRVVRRNNKARPCQLTSVKSCKIDGKPYKLGENIVIRCEGEDDPLVRIMDIYQNEPPSIGYSLLVRWYYDRASLVHELGEDKAAEELGISEHIISTIIDVIPCDVIVRRATCYRCVKDKAYDASSGKVKDIADCPEPRDFMQGG